MLGSPIKAIAHLKLKQSQVPVIPLEGIKYFSISVGVLLLGLVVLETLILPGVEFQGKLISRDWVQEDRKIDRNNRARNRAWGNWKTAPAADNWVWRSRGYPVKEAASQPKRILVMGDSYIWGDGYANFNDIWWRQLQRELWSRGYSQVDVIGAGINGASTRAQLEQARQLLPKYRPDLIIWGYVTNDADEIRGNESVVKRLDKEALADNLESFAKQGIFPHLTQQLHNLRMQALAKTKTTEEKGFLYDEWQLKLLEGENATLYQQTLKDLQKFHQSAQVPGFAVTLPAHPDRPYFQQRYERVKPLFAKAGFPLFDILPEYLQWSESLVDGKRFPKLGQDKAWGINPADGHPGSSSTYFFGRRVTDILVQRYATILGKKSTPAPPRTAQINDWMPSRMEVKLQQPGELSFVYPANSEEMLKLPVNRPFVQFNLSMAMPLKEIQLSGAALTEATLDITYLRSSTQPFDDHTVKTLSTQRGNTVTWRFTGENSTKIVNTIRFSAKVEPSNRQLTLKLFP